MVGPPGPRTRVDRHFPPSPAKVERVFRQSLQTQVPGKATRASAQTVCGQSPGRQPHVGGSTWKSGCCLGAKSGFSNRGLTHRAMGSVTQESVEGQKQRFFIAASFRAIVPPQTTKRKREGHTAWASSPLPAVRTVTGRVALQMEKLVSRWSESVCRGPQPGCAGKRSRYVAGHGVCHERAPTLLRTRDRTNTWEWPGTYNRGRSITRSPTAVVSTVRTHAAGVEDLESRRRMNLAA